MAQVLYCIWYTVGGFLVWWILSNADREIRMKMTRCLVEKDPTVREFVENQDKLNEWPIEMASINHPWLMRGGTFLAGALTFGLWPITALLAMVYETVLYCNYRKLKKAEA